MGRLRRLVTFPPWPKLRVLFFEVPFVVEVLVFFVDVEVEGMEEEEEEEFSMFALDAASSATREKRRRRDAHIY